LGEEKHKEEEVKGRIKVFFFKLLFHQRRIFLSFYFYVHGLGVGLSLRQILLKISFKGLKIKDLSSSHFSG